MGYYPLKRLSWEPILPEVRMDLLEWWPLLSEGGTFCGSNYTTEGLDLLSWCFFFTFYKGKSPSFTTIRGEISLDFFPSASWPYKSKTVEDDFFFANRHLKTGLGR